MLNGPAIAIRVMKENESAPRKILDFADHAVFLVLGFASRTPGALETVTASAGKIDQRDSEFRYFAAMEMSRRLGHNDFQGRMDDAIQQMPAAG